MTDRSTDSDNAETDTDLVNLEAADPADAPQIAEDLADRLARELEGTKGTPASRHEDAS